MAQFKIVITYKVLGKFGGGMREDNKIKYFKCNICGFKKEDTGYTDKPHDVQSYSEMKEHMKTEHQEAFDDRVMEWHNGFIKWKNIFD